MKKKTVFTKLKNSGLFTLIKSSPQINKIKDGDIFYLKSDYGDKIVIIANNGYVYSCPSYKSKSILTSEELELIKQDTIEDIKLYLVFRNSITNEFFIKNVQEKSTWTYQGVGGKDSIKVFESYSELECYDYINSIQEIMKGGDFS